MDERRFTDRILAIRYTDLEEEKKLCKALMERSEREDNTYEYAFSHVYMFDSILALGDYSECDFFLSRGINLCRKNGYDDLLLVLCNLAGLYYLKLNDEQTALEYYLEGLAIAECLKESDTYAKLNNNIGMGFAGRDDWETAKKFFKKAYKTAEKQESELTISYLCNYSETCLNLGQFEEIESNLMRCSQLAGETLYYKIRIGCAWCSYYSEKGDKEKCIDMANRMLDLEIENYDNRFFVCDMLEGIIESLILVAAYELAHEFLQKLESLMENAPLVVRYRTLCRKIQYMEACDEEENLRRAYREYYDLELEMRAADDKMRAQSIQSRILLNEALHEREEMRREAQELETAGHLDELTGLYNRRYFNKMVSKAVQNQNITHLGIIMIDVDYFKQYNDYYGHFMGDGALKTVADVLASYAEADISVSRYGGDEFVCLCQNISDDEVDQYVDAVYTEMKKRNIPHQKSKCSDQVSLSIGYWSGVVGERKLTETMIQWADEALYKAKEDGRNCYRRKVKV